MPLKRRAPDDEAGPSRPPVRRGAVVEVKATVALSPSDGRRARSAARPPPCPPPPPLPPAAIAAGLAIDADPVAFLTGGARDFFSKTWEWKATVFKATPARKAWAATCLPSTDALLDRAEVSGRPLAWGADVVAARYVDGRRTDPGVTPFGCPASPSDRRRLMKSGGATLQVHHPQRWDDGVWRLVAALERDLGCLVGTNAYLTPAGGSQGLAPHWDDVDVFVIQVEGRKAWRVYEPDSADERLKLEPSGDLTLPSSRRPTLEATLSPGDVLYIPRGTIHQAATLDGGGAASNHLTVSAFQSWTLGDLAKSAVCVAAGGAESALPWSDATDVRHHADICRVAQVSRPTGLGLCLRSSLTPGAVYSCGLGAAVQRDMEARRQRALLKAVPRPPGKSPSAARLANPVGSVPPVAARLAAVLRALAAAVEAEPQDCENSLCDAAVDAMAADFFAHRMPPYPTQVADVGPAPTVGSLTACRVPKCFHLVAAGRGDPWLFDVVSSLRNPRDTHMVQMSGSETESTDEESDEDSMDGEHPPPPGLAASGFGDDERRFFAAALAATPDRPAVVTPDGGWDNKDTTMPIPLKLAQHLWRQGVIHVVSRGGDDGAG